MKGTEREQAVWLQESALGKCAARALHLTSSQ